MINNKAGTMFGDGDNPFSFNLNQETLREMVQNAYTLRSDLINTALHSRKDIEKECDYPDTADIGTFDYQRMYDRNPIATRVVGVMPDETWQLFPQVFEDEDAAVTTEFEKEFASLGKVLQGEESWFESPDEQGNPIWEYLYRADRLSGIGSYGIVLIGIDDGKPLHEPVDGFQDPESNDANVGPIFINNQKQKRKLLYLSVFGEPSIQNIEFEYNEHSPRYRKPKIYNIDLGSTDTITSYVASGRNSRSVRVHWSRVVHIADNMDASETLGVPRMRPVWNNLLDLMKIYGGDAEGFWKGCVQQLFLSTHPQLGGDVTLDETALRDRMWDMQNGLQRWAVLMGLDVKSVAPTVVDPSSHINVQIEAICIKIGIPKRIFMGSERGELASSQDDSSWNDRVRGRRNTYVTPRIVVPFVNRLIQLGVLPEPKSFKVIWTDPDTMTPIEKAELALKRAETMVKYLQGQVDTLYGPMDFMVRELEIPEEEAEGILERAMEAVEKEKAEQQAQQQVQVPGAQPEQEEEEEGQQSQQQGEETQQGTEGQEGPTVQEDPYGTWEDLGDVDFPVDGQLMVNAEKGKRRPLNRPFRTPKGPKKFAVYTKNDKGNVVLVRFGDSDMEIKRDDPERRKNFRARHGCDDPGPKWKPKFWSCKFWSSKSVSDLLGNEVPTDPFDQTDNAFCPTGKGGGVDPTCSPKERRSLGFKKFAKLVKGRKKRGKLGSGKDDPNAKKKKGVKKSSRKKEDSPKKESSQKGSLVSEEELSERQEALDKLGASNNAKREYDSLVRKQKKEGLDLKKDSEERRALQGYSSDTYAEGLGHPPYKEINRELINGKSFDDIDVVDVDTGKIDVGKIQEVASRELPEPMMVYRGVSGRVGDKFLEFEGDTVVKRGFSSTSVSPRVATSFGDASNTVIEIKAKRGVVMNGGSLLPEEMEVLQPHGSKYRILGSRTDKVPSATGGLRDIRVIMAEEV